VPCSPKSAHAGSKILPEKLELWLILFVREEVGPRVTDDYEPRQIREEAAVNNSICITKQSGLITFFYLKIITLFVQRRMHDQGIFFLVHPTIPFFANSKKYKSNESLQICYYRLSIPYFSQINIFSSSEFFYERGVRRNSIHKI